MKVKEDFSTNISEAEKEQIRKWIIDNNPKLPQNIRLECGEYVFMLINDENDKMIAYKVIKPDVNNSIPQS